VANLAEFCCRHSLEASIPEIGDNGVLFSRGTAAKIGASASGLAAVPGLLLLDEATSALDQENESRCLRI